MLKRRRDPYLALEALDGHVPRALRRQDFHHDAAAECRLGRDEDARHSPAAELALQRKGASECLLQLLPEVHRAGEEEGDEVDPNIP